MITFANGETLETIAVIGGKEEYQQARRNTLELIAAADTLTLDKAAQLAKDTDALSQITITEEGGGSVHYDFTLPMAVTLTKRDDVDVVTIKLAQKSAIEMAQAEQGAEINDAQMALIELAGMVAGGDSNG